MTFANITEQDWSEICRQHDAFVHSVEMELRLESQSVPVRPARVPPPDLDPEVAAQPMARALGRTPRDVDVTLASIAR